jgi:CRP/FNR family transcriptional regulator, cyclic AMP receptor protein
MSYRISYNDTTAPALKKWRNEESERVEMFASEYEALKRARELLNLLCERLRRTSEQLEDVLFLDVQAHMAKILLRFAEAGSAPQPGVRVVVGVSQRELGNLVGA